MENLLVLIASLYLAAGILLALDFLAWNKVTQWHSRFRISGIQVAGEALFIIFLGPAICGIVYGLSFLMKRRRM